MDEIANILHQPGGYEVAWDYCLENGLCLCFELEFHTHMIANLSISRYSDSGTRSLLGGECHGIASSGPGSNSRAFCHGYSRSSDRSEGGWNMHM